MTNDEEDGFGVENCTLLLPQTFYEKCLNGHFNKRPPNLECLIPLNFDTKKLNNFQGYLCIDN